MPINLASFGPSEILISKLVIFDLVFSSATTTTHFCLITTLQPTVAVVETYTLSIAKGAENAFLQLD
jgi:hypothetical protein